MNKVINSNDIRQQPFVIPDKVTLKDPALPFYPLFVVSLIVMFSPPQVIFRYSSAVIIFPSPSSFSYHGAPIKEEIFFSFPPIPGGLRIHGEVFHNDTWEH